MSIYLSIYFACTVCTKETAVLFALTSTAAYRAFVPPGRAFPARYFAESVVGKYRFLGLYALCISAIPIDMWISISLVVASVLAPRTCGAACRDLHSSVSSARPVR